MKERIALLDTGEDGEVSSWRKTILAIERKMQTKPMPLCNGNPLHATTSVLHQRKVLNFCFYNIQRIPWMGCCFHSVLPTCHLCHSQQKDTILCHWCTIICLAIAPRWIFSLLSAFHCHKQHHYTCMGAHTNSPFRLLPPNKFQRMGWQGQRVQTFLWPLTHIDCQLLPKDIVAGLKGWSICFPIGLISSELQDRPVFLFLPSQLGHMK